MPWVPFIVIGEVLAAFGWFGVAVGILTVAAIGYSAYMMATMGKPPSFDQELKNRSQTIRSSVQPHRMIYGEVVVGGVLVFAQSYDTPPLSEQEMLDLGYIHESGRIWRSPR